MFSLLSMDIYNCSACDGGDDWELVRGAPKKSVGMTWFKGNDKLAGTDVYGDVSKPQELFSVQFDNKDFDQYQLATGNCDRWMVFSKEALINFNYVQNQFRHFYAQNQFPLKQKTQAKLSKNGELRVFE